MSRSKLCSVSERPTVKRATRLARQIRVRIPIIRSQVQEEIIKMSKEIAIGKRATISEAQQTILLAVLGASVLLGVAISLTLHFISQITFNAKVIAAEEKYRDMP